MKNKLPFFLITIFLLSIFGKQVSYGQNILAKQWDYRFGGTFDDYLYSLQQTDDGGYILGGYSMSGISGDKTGASKGGYDYWIVKINAQGNKQWDKDFGGTSGDYLVSIRQTSDKGFILGGMSGSGIGGDKSQSNWGNLDFWIIKTDSLGNKQWDKDFGGTIDDFLYDIQQTTDGGYILGGYSASGISGDKSQPTKGFDDYWIVKLDSLGNKQWDKDFGGFKADYFFSMQQTTDGGYILGGYSYSSVGGDKTAGNWSVNSATCDYWIVKIDFLGIKQWDKGYGGKDGDKLFSVKQTTDGGYVLGGFSSSGITGDKTQPTWGSMDYWIVKTDSLGNQQWDKDFGGIHAEDASVTISQTNDKGYLIAGTSYSPISGNKTENNLGPEQSWIVKTDSTGNIEWDKTLHTNSALDDENGIAIQTMDGCFVIANYTAGGIGGDKTQNCRGNYDFWIIKYCDSTVVVSNVVNLTSSDTIFCGKQYIDFFDHSTNNPTSWQWYFPGGSPSSSTLQNPIGIYYNSYGSFDVTLIACNASGCDTLFLPDFIKELPNPPVPIVTWIVDTLYSTPAYSYQWYLNSTAIPGANNQYYVFQQPANYFVIITDSNGCATSSNVIYTGIDEAIDDNASVYVIPNPNDGNFILYGVSLNSNLKIYDVEGRVIFTSKILSHSDHVQLRAVDGIYYVEVMADNKISRKKIVMKN